MAVQIIKNLSKYNLLNPNEKQWLVELRNLPEGCPHRAISQTWDKDDEPDIDGLFPNQIAFLILDRSNQLWLDTSRKEIQEVVDWINDNEAEVNVPWIKSEIDRLSRKKIEIEGIIQDLYEAIHELTSPSIVE